MQSQIEFDAEIAARRAKYVAKIKKPFTEVELANLKIEKLTDQPGRRHNYKVTYMGHSWLVRSCKDMAKNHFWGCSKFGGWPQGWPHKGEWYAAESLRAIIKLIVNNLPEKKTKKSR